MDQGLIVCMQKGSHGYAGTSGQVGQPGSTAAQWLTHSVWRRCQGCKSLPPFPLWSEALLSAPGVLSHPVTATAPVTIAGTQRGNDGPLGAWNLPSLLSPVPASPALCL